MLQIKNLTKKYPKNKENTLENIHVTFPETGLYYILGASGSGKSTLLSLIGGMDFDYQGSIKYNKEELKEMTEKERSDYRLFTIAFSFQDNKSNDKESVEDCILKSLSILDLTKEEKEKRIQYYLKRLQLEDKRKRKMETLSGGERKRISLIRALVKKSNILLCDEPLSSLNKDLRKTTTDVLKEESRERLVLIITHEKDEIPNESIPYRLENKALTKLKEENEDQKKEKRTTHPKRKNYSGFTLMSDIIKGIRRKSEFLIITLLSLSISLFAISFSFLLSHGVKDSLEKTLGSYMSDNCMVIESKESRFEDEKYQTADYAFLSLLKRNYPDQVADISPFYLENLDDLFKKEQRMTLRNENRTITLNRLSVTSFLEYQTTRELGEDEEIHGKKENLNYDEVILKVDYSSIASMYFLLYNRLIPTINDDTLKEIVEATKRKNIGLRIQLSINEYNYTLDHMVSIVGLVFSKSTGIVHSESDFNEHFLKDIMHFKDYYEDEEEKERTPVEIPKCLGIRIYPNKLSLFLRSFLFDKKANRYTLKPLDSQTYYRKEDKTTHNRFGVYKDYLNKVNPSEILEFALDNQDKVESISYSTPVFTFTASGYISGFTKPFFFSKYKEKLNDIQDSYLHTSLNLGQFQGSQIKTKEGVIKGDLLSSSEKNGLRYYSLDQSDKVPILGTIPKDYSEIGISRHMAEYLFGSIQDALDKPLQVLMLVDTVKTEEGYDNIFDEGMLEIKGIYDDKENAIYQDSLFPLCYCFENSRLKMEDIKINQAVLKVDLTHTSKDDYQKKIRKYGDYRISFPMMTIMEEIENTMDNLSKLFLFFASLSLVLASSLLFLSMYLILQKDRKEIGILLSLGYRKEEISKYYILFSLTVGTLGYLLSLFITSMAEKILQKTLVDLLSVYSYSLKPYLISFLTYFTISLLLGILLSIRIMKSSPKDAFLK